MRDVNTDTLVERDRRGGHAELRRQAGEKEEHFDAAAAVSRERAVANRNLGTLSDEQAVASISFDVDCVDFDVRLRNGAEDGDADARVVAHGDVAQRGPAARRRNTHSDLYHAFDDAVFDRQRPAIDEVDATTAPM